MCNIVICLSDKKVCGIACGGLHNAVFTETGQVYTWGCGDDGSLGRLVLTILSNLYFDNLKLESAKK